VLGLSTYHSYDTTIPLDPEDLGVEERNGVLVHDVSFADARGGRTSAYWSLPPGRDRFPAVIYVHPAPGDRSTFFEEGVRLGGLGIASLLVEAPWAAGEAFARSLGTPEQNLDLFVAIVRDLRRAVDFTVAQRRRRRAVRLRRPQPGALTGVPRARAPASR
jgi:hypothetical protein